ncbi:MAG: hypothetical protein PUP93_20365 [Rhizonema sp. NSF051]|nr:hypothetical protein [Rhizonema sp. NSF051]
MRFLKTGKVGGVAVFKNWRSVGELGVYRWLVLSLIAYILAHWAYLLIATTRST